MAHFQDVSIEAQMNFKIEMQDKKWERIVSAWAPCLLKWQKIENRD